MKFKQYFIISLLFVFYPLISKEIENGYLDLSNYPDSIINLNGKWGFYWLEFLSLSEIQEKEPRYCHVPGNWIQCNLEKKGQGYATYYLKIRIDENWINQDLALYIPTIGTSYKIYINDKLYEEVGIVSTEKDQQRPMYGNRLISWNANSIEQNIVIHVSNFYHKSGGLWYKIIFGKKQNIENEFFKYLLFDLSLFGATFILALYHLGIYLQKKIQYNQYLGKELHKNGNYVSILYFSLFCFFLSIRILFVDHYLIYRILPPSLINWFLFIRIEYSTHILGFLWISFMYLHMFDFFFNHYAKKIVLIGTLYFFIELILFPPMVFTSHLIYFQIFLILFSIYLIILLLYNVRLKKVGSYEALFGGLILLLFTINDILHARSIIQTAFLTTFGVLIFILLNAFSISRIFELTFLNIKYIINRLKEENQILNALIPEKFLLLFNLNKNDVFKLNHKIKENLIITCIQITPNDNKNLSNFFISKEFISKIITISKFYHGELEKYDEESLIFLFPLNKFEILNYLNEVFTLYKTTNYNDFLLSIVIHEDEVEFEPLKIGNEIIFNIFLRNKNILKKMLEISHTFNISILLSEPIMNQYHLLENLNDIRFVKNFEFNNYKIPLWEIYEFDNEKLKDHKSETKKDYIQALKFIQTKSFLDAIELLNNIYKNNIYDLLYLYYMNQILFEPSIIKFIDDILIAYEKPFNFNYDVGNKLINYQHELLIKCIIKLNSSIKKESVIDKYQFIEDTLTFLKLYSIVHFATEEYLMKIINYENLKEHMIEHEVFISTVESFFTQILWHKTHKEKDIYTFNDIKISMIESIANYLQNWIINHLLISDIQGYGKHLTQKEKILFDNWFDL